MEVCIFFPSRIRMSSSICSALVGLLTTACASDRIMKPPAANYSLLMSPKFIITLPLSSPCKESKASLFHFSMGPTSLPVHMQYTSMPQCEVCSGQGPWDIYWECMVVGCVQGEVWSFGHVAYAADYRPVRSQIASGAERSGLQQFMVVHGIIWQYSWKIVVKVATYSMQDCFWRRANALPGMSRKHVCFLQLGACFFVVAMHNYVFPWSSSSYYVTALLCACACMFVDAHE